MGCVAAPASEPPAGPWPPHDLSWQQPGPRGGQQALAQLLDVDAFESIAHRVVSALARVVDACAPDAAPETLEGAFGGIALCGQLCSAGGLKDMMGLVTATLYSIAGSGIPTLGNGPGSGPGRVGVSRAPGHVAGFQHNRKAQMATYALGLLACECAGAFGYESWRAYIQLIFGLRCHSLLSGQSTCGPAAGAEGTTAAPGADAKSATPTRESWARSAVAVASPAQPATPKRPTVFAHLLSALSLATDASSAATVSEEEAAALRSARTFVASAVRLDDVVSDSKFLPSATLNDLMHSLLEVAAGEAMRPKDVAGAPAPAEAPEAAPGASARSFLRAWSLPESSAGDLTAAVCEARALTLDTAFEVLSRNRDRAALVWPEVHRFVKSLLSSPESPLRLARAVVVHLPAVGARLLSRDASAPLVIATLEEIPRSPPLVLAQVAAPCARALGRMIRLSGPDLRSSPRAWEAITAVAAAPARAQAAGEPPVTYDDEAVKAGLVGTAAARPRRIQIQGSPLPPVPLPPAPAPPQDLLRMAVDGAHAACVAGFLPVLQALMDFAQAPAIPKVDRCGAIDVAANMRMAIADVVVEMTTPHNNLDAATRSQGRDAGVDQESPTGAKEGAVGGLRQVLHKCRSKEDVWVGTWLPLVRALALCAQSVEADMVDSALLVRPSRRPAARRSCERGTPRPFFAHLRRRFGSCCSCRSSQLGASDRPSAA